MRTLTIYQNPGETWRDTLARHGRRRNFEAQALAHFDGLVARGSSESDACIRTIEDLQLIPRFETQNTGPIAKETVH